MCCGHGAGDSGAVGHGYTEAERVRALGTRIKELGGDGVVLMDQSRNWFADHGFDTVQIPKGDAVVELHMDSGEAGSHGGHVIYKAGFAPDAYDRALADAISGIFPGRAESLKGRTDLRNCNVCSNRGINYRLVEHGFISDAGDVATFNSKIDEIARMYLTIFGVSKEDILTEADYQAIAEHVWNFARRAVSSRARTTAPGAAWSLTTTITSSGWRPSRLRWTRSWTPCSRGSASRTLAGRKSNPFKRQSLAAHRCSDHGPLACPPSAPAGAGGGLFLFINVHRGKPGYGRRKCAKVALREEKVPAFAQVNGVGRSACTDC